MRRLTLSLLLSILSIASAGCDIFVAKVGGEGQPCADNGACDEDLACNFDECTEPREEGEECDDSHVVGYDWTVNEDDRLWLDSYDVCESDMCCVAGECAEIGNMADDPDTILDWSRCPVGSSWVPGSCRCVGEIYEIPVSEVNTVDEINDLCDPGSRLPFRNEFVQMLGGCDDSVDEGGEGDCNPCAENEDCARMFTFLEYGAKLVMYTRPEDVEHAWFVNMRTGEVFEKDLGSADFDANAICVQND